MPSEQAQPRRARRTVEGTGRRVDARLSSLRASALLLLAPPPPPMLLPLPLKPLPAALPSLSLSSFCTLRMRL